MKRMICQRPSLLRPKMSRPCSSVVFVSPLLFVFVVSVYTSRTAAMSPSANISLMLSAGWPGHRRAEATPSCGRLCPAMKRMLLVQLLAAIGHRVEKYRGLAVEEVDIGGNGAAGRGMAGDGA